MSADAAAIGLGMQWGFQQGSSPGTEAQGEEDLSGAGQEADDAVAGVVPAGVGVVVERPGLRALLGRPP